MSDCSLFEDAAKAYFQYCKDNNVIYQEPAESESVIRRNYIYLKNINGNLAKYEIATKKIV